MTLADVTRSGVLAAVEEFNRLGREVFLEAHGFSRSKAYFLDHEGKLYDSKPLMGSAHGVDTGTPLGSSDFSGGDKTVARQLEALGFTVAFLQNPEWTRDELILVCEAVEANGWQRLDINDERVRALSQLLQSPAIHRGRRNPEFRNPAGVALKTRNLATPGQGHIYDAISEEFRADPVGMRALAGRIRELLQQPDDTPDVADPDIDEIAAREGGVALRAHLRRERDPRLRRLKIAEAKRRGEPITCEACDFDFERVYGDRGRDYIECHHRTPLHVTGETDTRLSDLALICSNCHRMVHRIQPWLAVETLRELVACQSKG